MSFIVMCECGVEAAGVKHDCKGPNPRAGHTCHLGSSPGILGPCPGCAREAGLRSSKRDGLVEMLEYVKHLARQSNGAHVALERLSMIRIGVSGHILDLETELRG